jgi:type IV fimbrial biogenesis protein FimT
MEFRINNARNTGRAFASRTVCRGVTVVELMVALSILAVLLTVGIPSYANLLHKNRISQTSGLLHVSLHMARGEAIKRRRPVQVCPSADGASCRNDGDWSEGWVVFADTNGNNTPDAGEVVRLVDMLSEGITVRASETVEDYLRFEPTGMVMGSGGASGNFKICHLEHDVHSNMLHVMPAGQVRLQQTGAGACGA